MTAAAQGSGWLRGCGTALVTPFAAGGEVDEAALARLVEFQIEQGIDFLVPCGTTGESVTMSLEEQAQVVGRVVDRAAGRVPVLAGAGGNNTRQVIEVAGRMRQAGADGILSVTPYYNKPPQSGLFRHYAALAEAVELPVVLYNVPGRTSVNLLPPTVLELAAVKGIVGIKEASGDIAQISEIAAAMPAGFRLLSGDDANILPLISVGGHGVISVTANVAPGLLTRFTHACLAGELEAARERLADTLALARACFCETNPIPVKAALAMMGLIEENYRLPLVPLGDAQRPRLRQVLQAVGALAGDPG